MRSADQELETLDGSVAAQIARWRQQCLVLARPAF
jgi:hypothetical protein